MCFILIGMLLALEAVSNADSNNEFPIQIADFMIHNGVTFGMSKEEVKEFEQNNGFSPTERSLYYSFFEEGEYMGAKTSALVIEGSIAGIDDSRINYYFDDVSGELFGVLYTFKGGNVYAAGGRENPEIENEYRTLASQLEKKYSGLWEDCNPKDYPKIIDVTHGHGVFTYAMTPKRIRVNDQQWIYITHYLGLVYMDGFSIDTLLSGTGEHYLEYRLISNDDLIDSEAVEAERKEREAQEQREIEEEKMRQLNSDL